VHYNEIENKDVLYQIECTNFAGFRRKRLAELVTRFDEVIIKKWTVINCYLDYKELACNTQSTRNRDMTRRIERADFDMCDTEFYYRDEQSAIDAILKMWDADIFKKKSLIITKTTNEKVHRTV
jgi:hypothetical protein